jgi:hypothetical protein
MGKERLKETTRVANEFLASRVTASEIWLPVVGYEGLYEVSDFGRLRRAASGLSTYVGRLLNPRIVRSGYLQAILSREGYQKFHYVHILVARAFLGEPPDGMQTNHCDGIKTHVWLTNLEYLTAPANIQHAIESGLRKPFKGTHNPKVKLTSTDVLAIRAAKDKTTKELSQHYQVCTVTIRDILSGRNWTHLCA